MLTASQGAAIMDRKIHGAINGTMVESVSKTGGRRFEPLKNRTLLSYRWLKVEGLSQVLSWRLAGGENQGASVDVASSVSKVITPVKGSR